MISLTRPVLWKVSPACCLLRKVVVVIRRGRDWRGDGDEFGDRHDRCDNMRYAEVARLGAPLLRRSELHHTRDHEHGAQYNAGGDDHSSTLRDLDDEPF